MTLLFLRILFLILFPRLSQHILRVAPSSDVMTQVLIEEAKTQHHPWKQNNVWLLLVFKKRICIVSLKPGQQYQSPARWWKAVFTCDKLSETPLSIQSHRQLLLPWGRADWDCMPLIVWVVHFAWAHEAEGWFGGYSCVPLRSNYRRQDGAAALWDSSVKPGIAPARHRRSAWDNTAFILHQRLVLFVWRESVPSLQPVFRPGFFFFFPFSLLEVENWRGLHMIPVWSCFCEVLSFCEDVKRNRHQNLNVDARRDASVRLLFFFLSSWIIISYLSH